jgi:hypothetical protein
MLVHLSQLVMESMVHAFIWQQAFHGARVRRIVGFFIQETSAGIKHLIQSLEAFYGNGLIMLRYE